MKLNHETTWPWNQKVISGFNVGQFCVIIFDTCFHYGKLLQGFNLGNNIYKVTRKRNYSLIIAKV